MLPCYTIILRIYRINTTANFKTKLEHNEPLSYWGWVFTFMKSILFKHKKVKF